MSFNFRSVISKIACEGHMYDCGGKNDPGIMEHLLSYKKLFHASQH